MVGLASPHALRLLDARCPASDALSCAARSPWIMQAATAASIPHLVTILRSPAFSDNPSAPSNAPETPGRATNERTSTNLRLQARDRGRETRSREEAKKSVPMGSKHRHRRISKAWRRAASENARFSRRARPEKLFLYSKKRAHRFWYAPSNFIPRPQAVEIFCPRR